jgi:hypothetical protein
VKESKQNDWLVNGGPVEQINNFYKKVMKPISDEEIKDRQTLIKNYYKKNSVHPIIHIQREIVRFMREDVGGFLRGIVNRVHALFMRIFEALRTFFYPEKVSELTFH